MKSLQETINLHREAAKLFPEDYRNWSGFAYAASRSIDEDNSDPLATLAMSGFLRVSQLRTSNNLEYLCLLFSPAF